MDSKKLKDIKRIVKRYDITPTHENIHVLGICECGFPGINTDPFAPHAIGCFHASSVIKVK